MDHRGAAENTEAWLHRLLDRKEKLLNETRGRDRSEARTLGRGARTLIGFVLTVLLVATQAQFVAGAKPPQKEEQGSPAAESVAAAPEESPAPEAPAEEPTAEEAPPAEEPPAEEAPPADDPAEEPAPDPSVPPADDGGSSEGGDTGDGSTGGGDETGTEPDPSTDVEDPATDTGDGTAASPSPDGSGEGRRLAKLLQLDDVRSLGEGNGSGEAECPEGTEFLVKFEWNGTSFQPEGDASGVAITGVTLDDDGEPRGFTWTSETPIAAITVKTGGGSFTQEFDPPATSGSFSLSEEHQQAISHVTFCVPVEQPEDRFFNEVVKVWLDEQGEPTDPPELPEGFSINIEGNGDNTGSLTCTVVEGTVSCEGDLEIHDPEDGVTVTETNPPEGWEIGDVSIQCTTQENETGGTDTSCVIRIENVMQEQPEDRFSLEVTKLWLDEEGNLSETPPEDLPEGFAVIIEGRGENQGSLTCSYDQAGDFGCVGELIVEDGEVVDVSEENAPEGWAAPDQATAECEESPNETGGTDTVCTISVMNIAEVVLGEQIIVSKAWLDLEGNLSTTPPEGTPDSFEIVITDGEGSLTCSYQEGRLACTGELEVEDGEQLDIIETDVPENWAGPEHARAQCVTDEETQSTTCIVAIRNIEQEVLPVPPIRPPARPSPGVLAVTGVELALMGLVALALVLAGIVLSYIGRREDETGT